MLLKWYRHLRRSIREDSIRPYPRRFMHLHMSTVLIHKLTVNPLFHKQPMLLNPRHTMISGVHHRLHRRTGNSVLPLLREITEHRLKATTDSEALVVRSVESTAL